MLSVLSVCIEVRELEHEYLVYMTHMDEQTLERLMSEYGQDVWNYAYMICKKHDVADEIAQDVFLQAYQHIAGFRGEASFKTWLLKIARNRSFNYRKSAFFRKWLPVERVVRAECQSSAEEDFLAREAVSDIWRLVFQLPAKYREVLLLDARHQLSIAEIAHVLGVAEGTVKSRLYRARRRLQSLLEQRGTKA